MGSSAPTTQKQSRTEFLSSAGTERTVFVLFCAIAVMTLLLTTVLGTDPAVESESPEGARFGLFERPPRAEPSEPQSATGGIPAATSNER